MHELGIVFYIIRDVKQAAQENGVSHVSTVVMNIGEVYHRAGISDGLLALGGRQRGDAQGMRTEDRTDTGCHAL